MQWDEQTVQSTNQRMKGLAINALLVQLYKPQPLSTGPAAKVRTGEGFAGGEHPAGTVSPQGPVWIGKDFRLDRTPRAAAPRSTRGGGGTPRRPHWRRGHWPHRAAWREASESADAVVSAGEDGSQQRRLTRMRTTPLRATISEHLHAGLRPK